MKRSMVSVIGSLCVVAILVTLSTGQEAKAPAKSKGRLPAYYKDVVTAQQKDQIYVIQSKYVDQIKKLQEEIKTLADKRDAEIEALLTPEQKTKIAALKAEGKKPAESKTTDAPTKTTATEPAKNTTAAPAKTATK